MKKKKLKTLIVLPAWNEELNIENVIEELKACNSDVDYVIVNDGSTDNTLRICREKGYNCINSLINLGLFNVVQTGLKYAMNNDYDIAIQFDSDGQHMPEYINDLIKAIEEGNNIAIASRFVTEKKPFAPRMFGSRVIALAIKIVTGETIKDPTSGMRAYDKETIKDYAMDINNPPEPDTLVYMIRKGKKIKEVQASMREREKGESIFSIGHIIRYMSRMVISILFIQPFRKTK